MPLSISIEIRTPGQEETSRIMRSSYRLWLMTLSAMSVSVLQISCASARDISVSSLKKAVQSQVPGSMNQLETMVNIDSGSRDATGLKTISDYLQAELEALGGTVQRLSTPPASGDMLIGTFKGTGKVSFLLLAHMDTVYPPEAARTWSFETQGDTATGPGVIDDKGGITVILGALQILRQIGFDRFGTITVAFNSDEEIGSPGSRGMIEKLGSQNDYALSCEPGGDQRIIATSGIATLTMHVQGKASHAGVAPQDGRNALVEAADIIGRTSALSDAARGLKFNWTMLNAGTRHNIIPDQAVATADIRYIHDEDVTALMAHIEDLAARPAVSGTQVNFEFDRHRPPMMPTDKARKMAQVAASAAIEFGKPIKILDTPFGGGSDAAYAAASGKSGVVESFGIGGEHAHTFGEETADLTTLPTSLYVMARTIIRLSGETQR